MQCKDSNFDHQQDSKRKKKEKDKKRFIYSCKIFLPFCLSDLVHSSTRSAPPCLPIAVRLRSL